MPETVANYISTNPDGSVFAQFDGTMFARGLLLPLAGGVHPLNESAIDWWKDPKIPASDPTGRNAEIRAGSDNNIPDVMTLSLNAHRLETSATALLMLRVANRAGVGTPPLPLPPTWQDAARIELLAGSEGKAAQQRLLLDGAGNSDFANAHAFGANIMAAAAFAFVQATEFCPITLTVPPAARYIYGVVRPGQYNNSSGIAQAPVCAIYYSLNGAANVQANQFLYGVWTQVLSGTSNMLLPWSYGVSIPSTWRNQTLRLSVHYTGGDGSGSTSIANIAGGGSAMEHFAWIG